MKLAIFLLAILSSTPALADWPLRISCAVDHGPEKILSYTVEDRTSQGGNIDATLQKWGFVKNFAEVPIASRNGVVYKFDVGSVVIRNGQTFMDMGIHAVGTDPRGAPVSNRSSESDGKLLEIENSDIYILCTKAYGTPDGE